MGAESPKQLHGGLPRHHDHHQVTAKGKRIRSPAGTRWQAILILGGILIVAILNILLTPKSSLPGSESSQASSKHTQARFVSFGDVHVCNSNATLESIRGKIAGKVMCPGNDGFLESITVFNSRFQRQPAIVVQPMSTTDISKGLALARKHGLKVSVKGGGHNPAGLAVPDGVMLFDMSLMRSVEINREDMTVTVGGGTLWKDVYRLLTDTGFSIVGGGCPTVGVVGIALSGGIGWLSRSRGLVSDNLLSATLVLGNGTVLVVSTDSNSKFLWGLRGAGGSNFGVVSSATLRLHPAEPSYFAGAWPVPVFDSPQLSGLLKIREEFSKDLKDDRLTVDVIINSRGKGKEFRASVSVLWILMFNGPKDEGLSVAKPLLDKLGASITTPQACSGKVMQCKQVSGQLTVTKTAREEIAAGKPFLVNHTFTSFASMFGASGPLYVTWKSAFVDSLASGAAERLSKAVMDRQGQSPHLNLAIQVEMLGGAMRNEPEFGSAYSHRDRNVLVSSQGFSMLPEGLPERETQDLKSYMQSWTTRTYEALRGIRLGAYSGYADPELPGWEEKLYSADNYRRLQEMKDALGASELFHTPMRVGWKPEENAAQAGARASSTADNLGRRGGIHQGTVKHVTHGLRMGRVAPQQDQAEPCSELGLSVQQHPFNSRAVSCCPSWAVQLAAGVKDGSIARGIQRATGPSLSGQHMLVVGGTAGLGNAVARMLGSLGATVILAQRGGPHSGACEAEAERSARDIGAPEGTFICIKVDLAEFSSIPAAVTEIKRVSRKALDGVVLSASTWGAFSAAQGAGNASTVLAVNVVGQAILMQELLRAGLMRRVSSPFGAGQRAALRNSAMAAARGGIDAGASAAAKHRFTRVVMVSSHAAYQPGLAPIESIEGLLANRPWEGGLYPDSLHSPSIQAYGASKAAEFLIGAEMARRLKGLVSIMVHFPKRTMRTNLTETVTRPHAEGGAPFQIVQAASDLASTEEGAVGIVALLTEKARTGHLYSGCQDASPWLEGGDASLKRIWPEHLQQPGGMFQCKVWREVQQWVRQASPRTLEPLTVWESTTEAGSMLRHMWKKDCIDDGSAAAPGDSAGDASAEEQVAGGW